MLISTRIVTRAIHVHMQCGTRKSANDAVFYLALWILFGKFPAEAGLLTDAHVVDDTWLSTITWWWKVVVANVMLVEMLFVSALVHHSMPNIWFSNPVQSSLSDGLQPTHPGHSGSVAAGSESRYLSASPLGPPSGRSMSVLEVFETNPSAD